MERARLYMPVYMNVNKQFCIASSYSSFSNHECTLIPSIRSNVTPQGLFFLPFLYVNPFLDAGSLAPIGLMRYTYLINPRVSNQSLISTAIPFPIQKHSSPVRIAPHMDVSSSPSSGLPSPLCTDLCVKPSSPCIRWALNDMLRPLFLLLCLFHKQGSYTTIIFCYN